MCLPPSNSAKSHAETISLPVSMPITRARKEHLCHYAYAKALPKEVRCMQHAAYAFMLVCGNGHADTCSADKYALCQSAVGYGIAHFVGVYRVITAFIGVCSKILACITKGRLRYAIILFLKSTAAWSQPIASFILKLLNKIFLDFIRRVSNWGTYRESETHAEFFRKEKQTRQ